MNWAPYARIILRYIAGAGVFGSLALGEELAGDPDLVLGLSLAIATAVELVYAHAKRRGWDT
jgi:hypothetical protein